METPQNFPKDNKTTEVEVVEPTRTVKTEVVKQLQDEYISYCAVGGLLTGEDGTIKKVNISQFAEMIGVDRKTLNNWKRSIPNFWDEVDKKRRKLFSGPRMSVIWNGLFLRAAKGDAEQAKIILGWFADWQPPAQKHEVDVGGGLADLLQMVRKRKQIENAEQKRTVIGDHISATPAEHN
jgi:hypothetical protein